MMKMESLTKIMVKEKRQILIQHVHLKFGVALAISIGGIIFTFFKFRIIKPRKSKFLHLSAGIHRYQANSIEENGDHDHGVLQGSSLPKISQNRITFEDDEQKREIKTLESKIKILEERETNLEIKLLECHGLKDQQTVIMDLQNKLRLTNMETERCNVTIESLKSDNERLESRVSNHAKLVHELEAARVKIRLLKKKLRFEGERNREHILSIQERVMKMESVDEMQIKKRDKLKEELEEMKKSNYGLKMVNSDLTQKLEYVQMLVPSVLRNEEVQELKEENKHLKLLNEDLTKEIERINGDRCKDIEELVYVRWMNASLSCELRNYRLEDPSLEEKAINIDIVGPEKSLSSQASSCLTDIGENEDLSVDTNVKMKNSSKKIKVFSKLKRLLSGKGGSLAPKSALQRAVSVDNIIGKYSRGSSRRCSFGSGGQNCSSTNSSRRASDDGSSSTLGRMDSLTEDDNDWTSGT